MLAVLPVMTTTAELYAEYSTAQVEYSAAELALAAAADRRAVAVAGMADNGLSLISIGLVVGISSRGRVQQLVNRGRLILHPEVINYRQLAVEARKLLPGLRGRVRAEARDARASSLAVLDACDARRIYRRPTDNRHHEGGDWDWLETLHPAEVRRLNLRWRSRSHADVVDDVAERLIRGGVASPTAKLDEIMGEVWLPHTRIIDGAATVANGRSPAMRCYSHRLKIDALAPLVELDGYRPSRLLGPDDDALQHITDVLAEHTQKEHTQ